MNNIDYNIYATLLNGYRDYAFAEQDWNKYWGSSDDPQKSCEEYCEEKRVELINRINRVPFDSEAADKGTAFNEVIDCLIESRTSTKMDLKSDKQNDTITAVYKNRTFVFPLTFCKEFALNYKDAIPQYFTQAILPTSLGNVKLYGYVDELLPFCAVDIKTTNKYEAFKYRDTWQHKVYPYCLKAEGMEETTFIYHVVVFGKTEAKVYDEYYNYNPVTDIPALVDVCEGLIMFLKTFRNDITDKKIFNLL